MAGQHVEQQALRAVLLDLQQRVLPVQRLLEAVLLAHEKYDQQVHNRRHRGKVEHEEHRDGLQRHADRFLRSVREVVVEKSRHRSHHEVGEKPRHRLLGPLENHHPDRGEQRPQHDARRSYVAADRPLHDERHEQIQTRLGEAEELEIEVPQIDHESCGRYREINQRHRGGILDAHRVINHEPQHCRETHQSAREDEQRFLQPLLVGVTRDDHAAA